MAGITKSANINVTAREIDFVTSFERNWEHLREILGIMRPIKKAPGSVLKSKKAYGKLESGAIAEGQSIPYSEYHVIEKPYAEMSIEKFAKAVSIEAIKDHGYDVAVQMTDEEFKNDLQQNVTDRFYRYINGGMLSNNYASFQMALSMAKGLVDNKFKKMHRKATGTVGFANVLDVAEYLGNANVTIQTQYGFQYIKDFLGFNTIFLLSDDEVARGRVLATAVENIVMYYVDPADSDFAKAGLEYTVSGETNLIGFHTQGNYGTAVSEEFAILGVTLFAEYIDAVAVVTFGGPTLGVAPSTGTVLGKAATALQSNVVVGDNVIAGNLAYVTGYTGFSGDPAEQSGHYLALTFTPAAGATCVVKQDSTGKTVTLDSDGICVIRVTSADDCISIEETKDGKVTRRAWSLEGVVLA